MFPETETAESTTSEETETETEEQEETEQEEVVEDDEWTIDDLLNEDLSEFEEFEEGVNHKGLKPLSEVLRHVPPEARKQVHNLRSMVTRKTQELAQARKELAEQRAQVQADKDALLNGEYLASLKKLAEEPADGFDLFDEKGMEAKIKQEAARLMQEMLKPLEQQQKENARAAQIEAFKQEHPDLLQKETKVELYKLLQSRPELKLEDAYYILTARRNEQEARNQMEEKKKSRANRRNTIRKTSTGTAVGDGSKPPKGSSAWEVYQWHKAHQG